MPKTRKAGAKHRSAITNNKTLDAPTRKVTRNTQADCYTVSKITINSDPTLVRNETLEGRSYVVVPMVMMTVGVHSGSQGALLYPEDELSKIPCVWNHKPVVVYHPEVDGNGVSACSPDIIEQYKIGIIMNAEYDDSDPTIKGRLKAEAWIEEDRANAVDPRVMEAVTNEEMMELSTGVFTDKEKTSGTFNGERYGAIARNYRPDHLAVLPDQIGACSIKDGAGFIRNALTGGKTKLNKEDSVKLNQFVTDMLNQVLRNEAVEGTEAPETNPLDMTRDALDRSRSAMAANTGLAHKGAAIANRVASSAWKEAGGKGQFMSQYHENTAKMHDQQAKSFWIEEPTDNELSFDDIRSQLYAQMTAAQKGGDSMDYYISDVYSDSFVYVTKGKLFRQAYNCDDDTVTLEGDPEAVVRVTSYETATANSLLGNSDKPTENMDKKAIIASLVSNHGYTKTEEKHLLLLSEATLNSMLKHADEAKLATENAAAAAAADDDDDDDDTPPPPKKGAKGKKPTGNAEQPVIKLTMDNMPEEFKQMVATLNAQGASESARLVKLIMNYEQNPFTEDQLKMKTLADLQGIAKMIPAPVGNFGGMGDVGSFIENGAAADEPVLALPTMNFAK